MESAIPTHLKCPRLHAAHVAVDYKPPYPAWVARFNPGVTQVVMAYFGVQCPAGQDSKALTALDKLVKQLGLSNGAQHHDLARYVDEAGYTTYVAIGYWSAVDAFNHWAAQPGVSQWWNAPERSNEGVGYFREIFCPRVTHFETLYSTPDKFEGVANMAVARSDEILEHGYWNGARDRLPAGQTESLEAPAKAAVTADAPAPGRRIKMHGHDNVTLIRSGQDWGATSGKERDLYLKDIEPALRKGMEFLRDDGGKEGCYYNRYMRLVDAHGKEQEKTFGLSLWKSLAHLEAWAESHPTHIAIFGTFMRVIKEMNFDMKLRLYHEVMVAHADEQTYEYVNCHPKTGLLRESGPHAKL